MKEIDENIIKKMGEIASLYLWNLGAIKINLEKPFKLASGNFSPIYINCRILISSPTFIHFFVSYVDLIIKNNNLKVNVVAGGESAGIPFASFISNALNIPMVYVRKKAKEHGISSLIEGEIKKGDKVLLIEDLITDAGSKMSFIDSLKIAGAVIQDVIVIFDREQGGKDQLKNQLVNLYSLSALTDCLEVGYHNKLLDKNLMEDVLLYHQSPKKWHENNQLNYY